ncbi:hypothetical protein SDC9_95091 [bioreactor metagenome]|uniref:Uncharacterized protein n=1 Tax=bioreactor metagenome TaxID=1076179 RepID=A0A645A5L0_9ZZZZ
MDTSGHFGRAVAQQGAVVAGEGHRGDDRHLRGDVFGGADSFYDLVKIGKGFQDQQVHPGSR